MGCDAGFSELRATSKPVMSIFKNATFACPNNCPEQNLTLSGMDCHFRELCTMRLVKCPLGCGNRI
jgi:hypothetical protein